MRGQVVPDQCYQWGCGPTRTSASQQRPAGTKRARWDTSPTGPGRATPARGTGGESLSGLVRPRVHPDGTRLPSCDQVMWSLDSGNEFSSRKTMMLDVVVKVHTADRKVRSATFPPTGAQQRRHVSPALHVRPQERHSGHTGNVLPPRACECPRRAPSLTPPGASASLSMASGGQVLIAPVGTEGPRGRDLGPTQNTWSAPRSVSAPPLSHQGARKGRKPICESHLPAPRGARCRSATWSLLCDLCNVPTCGPQSPLYWEVPRFWGLGL